jgi:hypothetical protein
MPLLLAVPLLLPPMPLLLAVPLLLPPMPLLPVVPLLLPACRPLLLVVPLLLLTPLPLLLDELLLPPLLLLVLLPVEPLLLELKAASPASKKSSPSGLLVPPHPAATAAPREITTNTRTLFIEDSFYKARTVCAGVPTTQGVDRAGANRIRLSVHFEP